MTNNAMDDFVWTEALSVGVDVIDEDHRAIFRLPQLIKEILAGPSENQRALVETVLNILEEYVEGHFLREQRALASANYEDLAGHIALHDAFAKKAYPLIYEAKNDGKGDLEKICRLVTDWLVNHISTVDLKYKGILTNENVDNLPLFHFIECDDDEVHDVAR